MLQSRLVELLLQIVFAEIRREAAAAHGDALHVDIRLAWIELDAGVSGGGKDAAPVRVGTGDRRFDQRRIGDGASDARGVGFGARALHINRHQLLRAFAVAHDLLRERHENLGQRVLERLRGGPMARSTVRKHGDGVVGGGVAVHGNAVIAAIDGLLQSSAQKRRRDHGVGDDESQRGGHIRLDHSRSLGHAGDARALEFRRSGLGNECRWSESRPRLHRNGRHRAPRPASAERFTILDPSISTPITPVEAGRTCSGFTPKACAAAFTVCAATFSPVRVAQLAFPALTRMARAMPARRLQIAPRSFDGRGNHADSG